MRENTWLILWLVRWRFVFLLCIVPWLDHHRLGGRVDRHLCLESDACSLKIDMWKMKFSLMMHWQSFWFGIFRVCTLVLSDMLCFMILHDLACSWLALRSTKYSSASVLKFAWAYEYYDIMFELYACIVSSRCRMVCLLSPCDSRCLLTIILDWDVEIVD